MYARDVANSSGQFAVRIGRKAMTLGGDSSKAAIARSAVILSVSNTCSPFMTQCDSTCMEIRSLSGIRHACNTRASRMAAASFTSQASASQLGSTKLPSRSTRVALERRNFRPTHHTAEKYNTEHTSTTGLAARIASTVNSYTELVLVHVQKSYIL